MLARSSHAWKVNFCKFTNETRNGMEDSSRHSGIRFLAACNGTTAGGGYELALACDEVVLVDDRSSAVSLPEVPLLGVLPGTGGLTRLVDKRRVRRDHADMFCTTPDGVRGQRAVAWRLVDASVRTQEFAGHVRSRAAALAQTSGRPESAKGIRLKPVERRVEPDAVRYRHVEALLDRARRTATLRVSAPEGETATREAAHLQGSDWWPLAMARELDDAILHLRTNEPELGLWLLQTRGNAEAVLSVDRFILGNQDDWFVRETLGMVRRTFARLEVSSRSIFAIATAESCFAGTLLELLLAADRGYMFAADPGEPQPALALSGMNFGALPTVAGMTRLDARQLTPEQHRAAAEHNGGSIGPAEALALGLVTETPDALDWDDELRQAIETRTALSPDALTGMEASLRFALPENQATRVFGRLSAWQNWIFIRPNAVGASGALKVYGSGAPAQFDWNRV
jgi:benzoyl-CoA-dihydrodiol lyase